jgi:hypothetical protein
LIEIEASRGPQRGSHRVQQRQTARGEGAEGSSEAMANLKQKSVES